MNDSILPGIPSNIGLAAGESRERQFVALLHRLGHRCDGSGVTSYRTTCDSFASMPKHERLNKMSDPLLRIWMSIADAHLTGTSGEAAYSAEYLDLEAELIRIIDRAADEGWQGSIGAGIGVVRDSPDRLLALVAPPTYSFDGPHRPTAYTIDVFIEACNKATSRIYRAWPQMGLLLPQHVRLLVHVPDGTFRSASAARYSGVVFLSSMDESILDLEESLVHELAHQVLYDLVEFTPILKLDPSEEFQLPWSRTTRDLYGFFHAYVVYSVLSLYYSLIVSGSTPHTPDERDRASARRQEIRDGLAEATETLESVADSTLTVDGLRILDELRASHAI